MNPILNFYKHKKVLITGHTGFKGSWLCNLLHLAGAEIIGISKRQKNSKHMFHASKIEKKIKNYYVDIRDYQKISKIIKIEKPEFIFHLAAQSLVPFSINEPIETWSVNLMGTLNVIESARTLNKVNLILITSDKCYKNNEWLWGYREIDQLGGDDPYSASKAACELLIHSQNQIIKKENKYIKIASARAGNVIGGGDWSDGRIIPDCFKSWNKGKSVEIRNIFSTRPWQFVLEPLIGYLKLGKYISTSVKNELSFNFGPNPSSDYTVKDLLIRIKKIFPGAQWQHKKNITIIESNLLKLNSEKAKKLLKWECLLDFDLTVKMTTEWYIAQNHGFNLEEFSIKQLQTYLKKLDVLELQ